MKRGGAAVLGSVQPQPIEHAPDGSLPLDKLRAAIKPKGDPHFARTRLLALENTFHGQLIPQAYVEEAAAFARQHDLAVHLDGARVFSTRPWPRAGTWPICANPTIRYRSVFPRAWAPPSDPCWSAAAA